MATPKRANHSGKRSWALWLLVLIVLGALAVFAWQRETIEGYAITGASYGARVACSCRYIGGRDIDDCRKDFESGMELVSLSEDAAQQSVTATFPLLESQTATYREGYGCVLEEWEG